MPVQEVREQALPGNVICCDHGSPPTPAERAIVVRRHRHGRLRLEARDDLFRLGSGQPIADGAEPGGAFLERVVPGEEGSKLRAQLRRRRPRTDQQSGDLPVVLAGGGGHRQRRSARAG